MIFEARLEKIFKQLNILRFPVKRGHSCGEWLWQFGSSVDVMKVSRIVVICQMLKGQQNLVCFDCRRCILTAELLLTGGVVLFLLFSWRCTGGAAKSFPRELLSPCRGLILGQSFPSSGCGRCLLQDEDHSGSPGHSFSGLYWMRSGTSPERFRSGFEVAGS